jgi:hypothetical protein
MKDDVLQAVIAGAKANGSWDARYGEVSIKEPLTQEPIAMLERIPRLGILRVTYEDAVTELHEGLYPLYVKPQIEVGCAECGVNGGYALYCVVCAEKFVGGYKDSGVPAVETGLEQVSPDTTPPKRPWVGLTDVKRDEILDIYLTAEGRARAIEAELKELNT